MELDIRQIQEILPHRYPFLLIDRVTDMEQGKWARAVKCVTANEPFFQGHFPGASHHAGGSDHGGSGSDRGPPPFCRRRKTGADWWSSAASKTAGSNGR